MMTFKKGNKLRKGREPHNKIVDEFTDLPISRQLKAYRRKRKKELEKQHDL